MTTIRRIRCYNCNTDNYVDIDIVHFDEVVNETNPLTHHCTFCTKPITKETRGNSL